MQARSVISVLLLSLSFATTGCAAGKFHQVNVASEAIKSFETESKGRTVYVVPNKQMKDSVLELQIRSRLEDFLLKNGYTLAGAKEAEVYMLATFGTGARVVAAEASVFKAAEAGVIRDVDGNPLRRVYRPDRMESRRIAAVENNVWLQLLSSDALYYRKTGMVRNLWRAEAATKAKPETLADAMRYLMVPTLKYFGKGTISLVTLDVREKETAWD
jgi:hypothetical protein